MDRMSTTLDRAAQAMAWFLHAVRTATRTAVAPERRGTRIGRHTNRINTTSQPPSLTASGRRAATIAQRRTRQAGTNRTLGGAS